MKRFRIRYTPVGGHENRFVLSLEGKEFEHGPCAKVLAKLAWDHGADEVAHEYDLNADDCETHRVMRVPN